MKRRAKAETLYSGRFLNMVARGGWEFVERTNAAAVVAITAVTDSGELLLVEQFRPPVRADVIELPAGLVGDTRASKRETIQQAAQRELIEETGFEAGCWTLLTVGPSSAGLTSEQITFLLAEKLTKKTSGGGDSSESIVVHKVPIWSAAAWLEEASGRGRLIDYKIFVGLYFLLSKIAGRKLGPPESPSV